MSRDSIDTLLNFIDRSPSPYHTVAASKKLLDEAGLRPSCRKRHCGN